MGDDIKIESGGDAFVAKDQANIRVTNFVRYYHGIVSYEDFMKISEELGITKSALRSFFAEVELGNVPADDLDHTLRSLAAEYKKLKNMASMNEAEIEKSKKNACKQWEILFKAAGLAIAFEAGKQFFDFSLSGAALRSKPLTVSIDEARKIFGLDENHRPLKYIKNNYQNNRNGTITDRATGLIWQQSGSDYTEYENIEKYVKNLNRNRFAGYNDWRLPTVNELMSLLEKEESSNGLYIDSIFDSTPRWCTTSDMRAGGGAWNVDFCYGGVNWDDVDDNYYVRVCRP